jgi:hypothetical protein
MQWVKSPKIAISVARGSIQSWIVAVARFRACGLSVVTVSGLNSLCSGIPVISPDLPFCTRSWQFATHFTAVICTSAFSGVTMEDGSGVTSNDCGPSTTSNVRLKFELHLTNNCASLSALHWLTRPNYGQGWLKIDLPADPNHRTNA